MTSGWRNSRPQWWVCVTLAVVFGVTAGARPQDDAINRMLGDRFGLTAAERNTLAGGLETARALPSSAPDGIAAIGAIWINARPSTYLEWAAAGPDFDRGSTVQAVRRLSQPPAATDFENLMLSANELSELERCRIGNCALQLDADGIRGLDALDWDRGATREQATAAVRHFMLDVASAYVHRGNAGLPHYHDAKLATDVEANVESVLAEEEKTGRLPAPLVSYLRSYPSAPLPVRSSSYLYWMTNSFGLKPTTRLNQTVVYQPDANGLIGIIATKQLYATHYFHGALDLRYIVANPALDDRFVLVMVTRTRSDGLTGLAGTVMGGTIRRRAIHSLRTYLRFTKEMVEKRQRDGWSPPSSRSK